MVTLYSRQILGPVAYHHPIIGYRVTLETCAVLVAPGYPGTGGGPSKSRPLHQKLTDREPRWTGNPPLPPVEI